MRKVKAILVNTLSNKYLKEAIVIYNDDTYEGGFPQFENISIGDEKGLDDPQYAGYIKDLPENLKGNKKWYLVKNLWDKEGKEVIISDNFIALTNINA